jgi:hypothetical protein
VCSADGRSAACDSAGQAGPEVCDGIDNDCNGLIDDGLAWQGIPVGGACAGLGACALSPGVVECTAALGVACSTAPGGSDPRDTPEVCNGVDDDCDGLTDEDGAILCDDGLPCTDDACVGGTCTHALAAGWCRIDGACVAAGAPDPDGTCQSCAPDLSTDAWSPSPDGAACDLDGDGCTLDECQANACTPGARKDCSALDAGPCTIGACVADSRVAAHCAPTTLPDGQACDTDGNGCTPEACSGGACVSSGTVDCSGENGVCRVGTCASTGPTSSQCLGVPSAQGFACDDGESCTARDQCDGAGTCAGTPTPGVACDDANPCTKDDQCDGQGACSGTAYTCDDGNDGTANVCDGQGGCSFPCDFGCLIAGICIPDGIVNPDDPCQVCDHSRNPTGWSPADCVFPDSPAWMSLPVRP